MLDNRYSTRTIASDISKVFDNVKHPSYAVTFSVINRTMKLVVNGRSPEDHEINAAVSQEEWLLKTT